jgi:NADH-ubiquinone oxidoreductase chain 6
MITIINLLSFGILFSSVFSITSKNPVISIIFLITTFVQAALYLILIGINFIGISYIVIYVGAIAVLFLFIIMMINIKLTDILDTGYNYTKNLPLGILIATLFIIIIFAILPLSFSNNYLSLISVSAFDVNDLEFLKIEGWSSFASTAFFYELFATNFNNWAASLASDSIIKIFNNIPIINKMINDNPLDLNLINFTQIEVLGHNLYTYGAILLIILSIILLLAMLATIIISKKNKFI